MISVGLLGRREAQLSHELLGDLAEELPDWEEADRSPFLDNAWNFASRLTTGLFDRHARKRLKETGWFVGDFEQEKGHRPEFIAVKQEHWARVAARVADPPESKSMRRTLKRLASTGQDSNLPRPVVVVPDHVDGLRLEIRESAVCWLTGR